MSWFDLKQVTTAVGFPEGYLCELLHTTETEALIQKLSVWFPEIAVGVASSYLRPAFYADQVHFDGDASAQKDIVVFVIKHNGELVGMASFQREPNGKVLYGRVGALAAAHRRTGLASAIVRLQEGVARAAGMDATFVLATLSNPHIQLGYERIGWALVGIAPGYDREVDKNGEVKRVYEGIYAKALVSEDQFALPLAENLSPKTRALFDLLFPGKIVTAP